MWISKKKLEGMIRETLFRERVELAETLRDWQDTLTKDVREWQDEIEIAAKKHNDSHDNWAKKFDAQNKLHHKIVEGWLKAFMKHSGLEVGDD